MEHLSTTAESDRALVGRIAAGNEDALRRAMALHGRATFAMARHVLADPVLAEEAAQDAFVALWLHPERFDPERGSLRAFLQRVTRNKAVDLVRSEERRRRFQKEAGESSQVDDSFDRLEERVGLVRALKDLSHPQRQAIALAYFGGLSYREVARRLGIPEGTAKTRLRDGLSALRASLAAA